MKNKILSNILSNNLHLKNTAIIERNEMYSFSQIESFSNNLAYKLTKEYQIKKGDRVVVIAEKSVSIIISAIAIWKVGAIYVPVDKNNGSERTDFIIRNVNANLVISPNKLIQSYSNDLEGVRKITYEEIVNSENINCKKVEVKVIPSDPAIILHTSGSTGNPKGVVLQHKSVIAYFEAHNKILKFKEGSTTINFGEFHFDISIQDTFLPLFFGATVILFKGIFISKLIIDLILKENVTHIIALSSVLKLITGEGDQIMQLKKSVLQLCQTGGEICDVKLINKWKDNLPKVRLYNGYGPTECNSLCMAYEIKKADYKREVLFPIGKPFSKMNVLLLDDNNELITDDGIIGLLCISGPQLMKGYWNSKELTQEVFIKIDNKIYYKTGDKAQKKGDQFYFEGRSDSEVKILGRRINLNEIRNRIFLVDYVDYAIVGVHNDKIYAYLHVLKVLNEMDIENLHSSMKNYLPSYMIPHHLYITNKIRKTSSGKINEKSTKEFVITEINKRKKNKLIIEL